LRGAMLRNNGTQPDAEFRSALEELQAEVAVLARFLPKGTSCSRAGFRLYKPGAGDTLSGTAAPLVLVNKLTVEG